MLGGSTWGTLCAMGGIFALAACSREAPPAPDERATDLPGRPAPARAATPTATPAAAKDTTDEAPDFVPAGSPVIPLRPIDFGVYLRTPVSSAMTADVAQSVHARFPRLKLLTKPEPIPPPTVLVFAPEMENVGLPSASDLARFGRGLSAPQVDAASKSKGALVFSWLLDADPKLADLRGAQDAVLDVALKYDGFVWDDTTRELYSLQAWKRLRHDGWQGDIPDARRFITIHYYRTEGRSRAVTLGMAKLGLPDLVVEDVPVMRSAAIVTVMEGIAQSLVEGAVVGADGRLPLDLATLHHAAARALYVAGAGPGATLRGHVALAIVDPEEGTQKTASPRSGSMGTPAPARSSGRRRACTDSSATSPTRWPEEKRTTPSSRASRSARKRVFRRLPRRSRKGSGLRSSCP